MTTLLAPSLATAALAARTLGERLASSRSGATPPADAGERDADVIHRWQNAFGSAGPERFARRLHWDGLAEPAVRVALRAAPASAAPAEWTRLLAEAAEAAAGTWNEADAALDPDVPIPFEEVLLPFVEAARRRLRAAAPRVDDVLAPAAQAELERALLSHLSDVAAQALLVDFAAARACSGRAALDLGTPGRGAYRDFVAALRAARLESLVVRHPVLVRLLAIRAGHWVSASAEFVCRAGADAAALATVFGGGDPGLVVGVRTGCGDTHAGGRAVAAVRFASGLEVMYKPRALHIDLAYYALLEWLAARGLEPSHRVLRTLVRDDYGWMEFVRPEPAEGEVAVRAYYERAGALLCLCYVLGAGDLHAENIIAAGAHPVPVDLEMLMWAPVNAATRSGAPTEPTARVTNVLSSLLLPFWNVTGQGPLLFGGGLGPENPAVRTAEWCWSFVNTDRMSRAKSVQPPRVPTNLPHLHGRPVPPAERVDDLVRGFERCHGLLEAHRDALCAPAGPMPGFSGQRVRVLLRDTKTYGAVMRRSLHPRFLRDGVERSLQLEVLRATALAGDTPLAHWAAYSAEQRDLEELDYPLFWAYTNDTTLHDSHDEPVGEYCTTPPYQLAVDRLAGLDAADREHQASLIRFIYAYTAGPIATASHALASRALEAAAPTLAPPAAGHTPLDAATALAEARAVADALHALVVREPDGSPQWVGIHATSRAAGMNLRRLSERLYDGRAGVALFLAALDAVGATGHATLAAEALGPVRAAVRVPGPCSALVDRLGIGAGLGVGGLVYTLTRIGQLSGDDRWLDDARRAAGALTDDVIASDTVLEVLGGAAGAALGLLTLHAATGDRRMLERAAVCGRRLLAARVPDPETGRRVWRVADGAFATGFAHGAGGIAYALRRLAAATTDVMADTDAFAAAADEAFAFEAEWRARRADPATAGSDASRRAFWDRTWCNGSVGVALGRAVCGLPIDDPVPDAEADTAERTPDHPCCGTLGRAELLLVAGYPAHARAMAGRLVSRAQHETSYYISRDVPEARCAPAFFQGVAGIAYQLLRITHPARLGSVLTFT